MVPNDPAKNDNPTVSRPKSAAKIIMQIFKKYQNCNITSIKQIVSIGLSKLQDGQNMHE
jgi:hypothetical protein